MNELRTLISNWVDENRDQCLKFLQEIIAIPSPSGEEKQVAEYLASKMRTYGYDSVVVDDLSDVMGVVKGMGGGRSFLLNGHLDHVPVGHMSDPYSGRVMSGTSFGYDGEVIYGRAASDMKAAIAAMVLAGRALKELDVKLKGDYKVAAVAQEETGGAGTTSTIVDSLFLADVVLIGESTDMQLTLGHRGSMKFSVVVKGRSCHASAPERGVNALYNAVKMIQRIQDDLVPQLPSHPIYGRVSLVVTQIEVSPKAFNVVPDRCQFWIDCRNHPGYTAEQLYTDLKKIISDMMDEDPKFEATVLPTPLINERTFTGYYTDPQRYPVVEEAANAIGEIYKAPRKGIWTFATDGRIYSHQGIPVLGFGPGEEKYAHTVDDHVKVRDYLDTIKVYAWLACTICGVCES